jgi:hypothetical protein
LKLRNACYHSVQKHLSSSLLSKNLKIKIYRTIILPIVLYGCESWSLNLREVSRLRVFQNRVLRGIFGLKREEVTGEWRKLHNEELHDLYSDLCQIYPSKEIMQTNKAPARCTEPRTLCFTTPFQIDTSAPQVADNEGEKCIFDLPVFTYRVCTAQSSVVIRRCPPTARGTAGQHTERVMSYRFL